MSGPPGGGEAHASGDGGLSNVTHLGYFRQINNNAILRVPSRTIKRDGRSTGRTKVGAEVRGRHWRQQAAARVERRSGGAFRREAAHRAAGRQQRAARAAAVKCHQPPAEGAGSCSLSLLSDLNACCTPSGSKSKERNPRNVGGQMVRQSPAPAARGWRPGCGRRKRGACWHRAGPHNCTAPQQAAERRQEAGVSAGWRRRRRRLLACRNDPIWGLPMWSLGGPGVRCSYRRQPGCLLRLAGRLRVVSGLRLDGVDAEREGHRVQRRQQPQHDGRHILQPQRSTP